ncbi:hypothetical protein ACVWZK_007501 [Bradyrhizobium sp. GM0.4]
MVIWHNQISHLMAVNLGSICKPTGNCFRFKLHIDFECLLAGTCCAVKRTRKRAAQQHEKRSSVREHRNVRNPNRGLFSPPPSRARAPATEP